MRDFKCNISWCHVSEKICVLKSTDISVRNRYTIQRANPWQQFVLVSPEYWIWTRFLLTQNMFKFLFVDMWKLKFWKKSEGKISLHSLSSSDCVIPFSVKFLDGNQCHLLQSVMCMMSSEFSGRRLDRNHHECRWWGLWMFLVSCVGLKSVLVSNLPRRFFQFSDVDLCLQDKWRHFNWSVIVRERWENEMDAYSIYWRHAWEKICVVKSTHICVSKTLSNLESHCTVYHQAIASILFPVIL